MLAEKIALSQPSPGELAVFYLAQAGFLIKNSSGQTVCIDPYLSDCCERMFGFKRMIPTLLRPCELETGFLVATHSHADHLDPDLLGLVAKNKETRFVGSPDCLPLYVQAGVAAERRVTLAAGDSICLEGIEFRAVYADHGELAPDAVGMLLNIDGMTIYDTGDTSYCPEKIMDSLGSVKIDIMIVPINPAFGNLGHENAVRLSELIKPQVVIGSHFGMFTAHGGDPAAFLECAGKTLPPGITPLIMAPGERLNYSREHGIVGQETFKQE